MLSKLFYGLDTAQLNDPELTKLNMFCLKWLRKIFKIPTTYAEMLGDLKDVSFAATDPKFLPLLEAMNAQNIPTVSIFLSGRPLVVNRQLNASDAFIAAWLPGSAVEGIADVIFTNDNKDIVIKKLKPLLEDPSIKKIGQNIKFDFIVLFKHGINITSMEDTMLMSYVLDAGKNRHNMDTLSEIHLGHKTISFKDLVGSGKKEINFSEVDIEKAKDYAAEDADITFRLYKKFNKNLKDEKMVNIYEVFEKPMIKILAFMEIEGIKIDNKFLNTLSFKFKKKIEKVQKEIFRI